jgi:hypothetical protein
MDRHLVIRDPAGNSRGRRLPQRGQRPDLMLRMIKSAAVPSASVSFRTELCQSCVPEKVRVPMVRSPRR